MADRKILTVDFKNLKAKVKAEMLRRQYSGPVSAYGGAAYDFSTAPADGGPLLGEHLKKNLEPMEAVNADGLPTYPGVLTQAGQEAMEAKVTAWATRSITDYTATDCKSGCTGTCYTSCQTGCYSGCSGCSGCGSGCANGCSGCGSGCAGGCSGGCDGGCSGCGSGCANGCSGGCKTGCSNCGNSCSTACNWGCGKCDGTCAGACTENGTF